MSNHAAESLKATREANEREYMNAKTDYDRWRVFQRVMDWATTTSELADELSRQAQIKANEVAHLKAALQDAQKRMDT